MSWSGTWRNQYGSVLEITDESNGRVSGKFRTALEDSGFFGQEIAVFGVYQGDCIGLTGGGRTPAGDAIVTYTGLLREGRIETLWYVVSDAAIASPAEGAPGEVKKLKWWRAMITGADTFEPIT